MDSTPDARLRSVSRPQQGPFTRDQALCSGFTPSMIKTRLASGRWIRLHRGVMCEVAVPGSARRDASAAVLACGPAAAASHHTAAALWEIDVPPTDRPHVTVPALSRMRPPGVHVHETTRLLRSEAAPMDGIRVTSPTRTLLDIASVLEPDLLELALDRLWRRGRVDPRRLAAYMQDDWCRTRKGSALLRQFVRERLGEGPAGSDIETLLVQIVRDANLPLPIRQYPIVTPFGVRYLDLSYPERRIAIELDGMDSRLDPKSSWTTECDRT